jgi:type I restriction enzyme S subunit
MPEFSRVDHASLDVGRLDAEYYGRVYVENADLIENKGTSLTLEEMRERATPIRRGIDMPQFVEDKSSPKMVTIASFDEPGIQFDQLKMVSFEQHNAFKGSHIQPDDLLVAMGGYAGKAAICPQDTLNCNIGRHTARVKIDPALADARYIWAFITCKIGTLQFERYITGSVQAGINLEDIRNIKIFVPRPDAQKYIGDKVRQAEQLRAWAKRLEVKLAFFENQIPTSKPVIGEAKHSKATLEFLTENRLDARYYAKKHLDLYAQFNNEFESFGSICSGFKYGASIAANYVNSEGLPFIRGNALSANRINQDDIVYLSKSLKDELKTACVEEGDILITRSGTVGVTTYVAAEHAKYWYGSFIIKCKLANKSYLPAYVSWYLNSWVGQQQFRRLENGAVQLNINTEELSSIAIWKAPQEFQTEVDKLLIEQISAVNLSKSLTSAAKTLVEALIEGQLTEQQLIQAQQALEDGDNSLDQAILSKLSGEGYAIDGITPLFSDIDELYRLLASAAQAETEE